MVTGGFGMFAYGVVIGWLSIMFIAPPIWSNWRPLAFAAALCSACIVLCWLYDGLQGAVVVAFGLPVGAFGAISIRFVTTSGNRGGKRSMDWTYWSGALGFGAVIGWYLYFINRYRKTDVQIGDLTTVIGAIGGAAVLKMFGDKEDLFGPYGIGIAVGFFGYFLVLIFLVGHSKTFNADWFLDGRRPNPPEGWGYGADTQGTVHAMSAPAAPAGAGAGSTQNFYFNAARAPGGSAGDAKIEVPIAAGQQGPQ